ncbi:hypothetical protein D3C79_962960 [compost metagenome]
MFFDGCALCDETHVEVRQFLVNFKDGGRYAPWNILPMCVKCGTKLRLHDNPFRWLDGLIKHKEITVDKRDMVLEYITLQIEKVSEGPG